MQPLKVAKKKNFIFAAMCSSLFFGLAAPAEAKPVLRCYVSYAGSMEIVTSSVVADPYAGTPADIAGRFKFKAVMVGKAEQIDYIKIYAYFQTRHADVPIHQATYLPPFQVSTKETLLTPQNSLYAGDVERELQYRCTLQEVPL